MQGVVVFSNEKENLVHLKLKKSDLTDYMSLIEDFRSFRFIKENKDTITIKAKLDSNWKKEIIYSTRTDYPPIGTNIIFNIFDDKGIQIEVCAVYYP